MDKNQLITIAANSKLLRNLAIKLCNYRDIHNDLFQEFLLYLCEKPDEFLLNKYNDAQFISYCSNCIKGLNSHRLRNNDLVNTKCPMVENCNRFHVLEHDYYRDFDDKNERVTKMNLNADKYHNENIYDFEIDEKIEQISKIDKFKSEVLFKSVVTSTRQVAQELGLNQRKLIYQNDKFKKELKRKLK
jgi:hypothetical protein